MSLDRELDHALIERLRSEARHISAEFNEYCGINELLTMLLSAWKSNPLLAAVVKRKHFNVSSE